MLRSPDRKAILDTYRDAGSSLSHGGHKLLLFADCSPYTSNRRQVFSEAMKGLRKKGIINFLLYPARLKVTLNNEIFMLYTPEEAQKFLEDN
ncbi:hypothetical protein ABVT39_001440 [Epinephelus coioides]